MKQHRSFEDNVYMKIIRWVYCLLMLNLMFSLTILPLFLAINFLAIDPGNLLWFILASLPIGAGFLSLLASLDRFYTERDIEPCKDYLRFLRKFWKAGSQYWLLTLGVLVVAVVDLLFLAKTNFFVWGSSFFLLLALAAMALFINNCYFQMRNPEKTFGDVLRISSYYLLKKWYISLVNTVLLFSLFVVMVLKPQIGFIVLPSVLALLVFLNCSKLHQLVVRES